MKIEARNAYNYIQHTKTLAYLSGKEEAADLKNYAYSVTGEEIYQKLKRIEATAQRYAERSCNGELTTEEEERADDRTRKQVEELLPRLKNFAHNPRSAFFINGDPRGYALKVQEGICEHLRALGLSTYTDFGGYFILAPEF